LDGHALWAPTEGYAARGCSGGSLINSRMLRGVGNLPLRRLSLQSPCWKCGITRKQSCPGRTEGGCQRGMLSFGRGAQRAVRACRARHPTREGIHHRTKTPKSTRTAGLAATISSWQHDRSTVTGTKGPATYYLK